MIPWGKEHGITGKKPRFDSITRSLAKRGFSLFVKVVDKYAPDRLLLFGLNFLDKRVPNRLISFAIRVVEKIVPIGCALLLLLPLMSMSLMR